ncbi:hypothetical protein N7492_009523 [Penicillium capsulatum]|uniref:Uncharacterized protein n=1 Tax=Penicillium capsulatum TaxID=69766 RepID=A0A9W9HV21_9EURO|nr:hypothetical protein N7492_009523 [Penicillium capsulatum]KAJ6106913.1 hypothetical protein N7512_010430 [Penicillium capsulatum]
MMSSSTDSTTSTFVPSGHTESTPNDSNNSDGVLSSVKQQITSVTDGASMSEIPSKVTAAAGEMVNGVKDTVVPAASQALHNAQSQIKSLTGEVTESATGGQDVNPTADAHDRECVDQMSTEQVCDFLREKHFSNRPPPSTN